MTTINNDFGEGGQQLTPTGGTKTPTLATTLQEAADDLAALRAAFVALTAKLDADVGVTDTDYNTLDPAATKTIRGS